MHRDAADVLRGLGGDESSFAARQLTEKIASHADLVLTMTRAHRDSVLELAPRQLRRTFTLAEAARIAPEASDLTELAALRPVGREAPDILDPMGEDAGVFQAVGLQIAALLPPIIDLLQRS